MNRLPVLVAIFGMAVGQLASPGPTGCLGQADQTPADITNAVDRAMRYLKGHEGVGSGVLQYSDYVVFCGLPVVRAFPRHQDILDDYQKWIAENDTFSEDYLYQSACHVMALDLAGHEQRAREMFGKIKPLIFPGNGALNPFISRYHLGWYLYGSIVAGDTALRDRILARLAVALETEPDKNHYFSAYCVAKVYEKTKDEQYRKLFLAIVASLQPYQDDYRVLAATDGHMGMTLAVFCRAFALTQDQAYRQRAVELAGPLVASQLGDGSWNHLTAYTIMPAEGLTAYLGIQ